MAGASVYQLPSADYRGIDYSPRYGRGDRAMEAMMMSMNREPAPDHTGLVVALLSYMNNQDAMRQQHEETLQSLDLTRQQMSNAREQFDKQLKQQDTQFAAKMNLSREELRATKEEMRGKLDLMRDEMRQRGELQEVQIDTMRKQQKASDVAMSQNLINTNTAQSIAEQGAVIDATARAAERKDARDEKKALSEALSKTEGATDRGVRAASGEIFKTEPSIGLSGEGFTGKSQDNYNKLMESAGEIARSPRMPDGSYDRRKVQVAIDQLKKLKQAAADNEPTPSFGERFEAYIKGDTPGSTLLYNGVQDMLDTHIGALERVAGSKTGAEDRAIERDAVTAAQKAALLQANPAVRQAFAAAIKEGADPAVALERANAAIAPAIAKANSVPGYVPNPDDTIMRQQPARPQAKPSWGPTQPPSAPSINVNPTPGGPAAAQWWDGFSAGTAPAPTGQLFSGFHDPAGSSGKYSAESLKYAVDQYQQGANAPAMMAY